MKKSLFSNWQHKLTALIGAIVIWSYVHSSITTTKTIPNVPIRIVNIPENKTVEGLLPNHRLNRLISLTLTGTRDVISKIEPGDLEVILSAENKPDEWFVKITKDDLVSLNPDINLAMHVHRVNHSEFIIRMDDLLTAYVPVDIAKPIGDPPDTYKLLSIWPHRLSQSVTGPEDKVRALQAQGLELIFDLSSISKEQLDQLMFAQNNHENNEVAYYLPKEAKKIVIPFLAKGPQPLNDPKEKNLHLLFLKEELIPLTTKIPISIYYPPDALDTINPLHTQLQTDHLINNVEGVPLLNLNLLGANVSKEFLTLVEKNLQISVIAKPNANNFLPWSLEILNQRALEKEYVEKVLEGSKLKEDYANTIFLEDLKEHIRKRFQYYAKKLNLHKSNGKKLNLRFTIKDNKITATDLTK